MNGLNFNSVNADRLGPLKVLEASSTNGRLLLPAGDDFLRADFSRAGPDLLIHTPGGSAYVVPAYFMSEVPFALETHDGAVLSAKLVTTLAGPQAAGMFAQAAPGQAAPGQAAQQGGALGAPIGQVSDFEGSVTVTHPDGTQSTLTTGGSIFQGDVLETAAGASVSIIFVDDTIFSLSQSGRMVMDEMVYDPGTQTGSFNAQVVQGVFSFVSGQVAKTSPDGMVVQTPTATIGIRGSTVLGEAAAEGAENKITLIQDVDGNVGEISVTNGFGTLTLNSAGASTSVFSANSAPSAPVFLSPTEIQQNFGSALTKLVEVVAQKATQDASRAQEKAQETEAEAKQADAEAKQADEASKQADEAAQQAQSEADAAQAEADAALAEAEASGSPEAIAKAEAAQAKASEAKAKAEAEGQAAAQAKAAATEKAQTAAAKGADAAAATAKAEQAQQFSAQAKTAQAAQSKAFEAVKQAEVKQADAQKAAAEKATAEKAATATKADTVSNPQTEAAAKSALDAAAKAAADAQAAADAAAKAAADAVAKVVALIAAVAIDTTATTTTTTTITTPPSTTTEPAITAALSQWATGATASTEYSPSPGSWSAVQATLAPDTFTYGDIETAWTADDYNDGTPDWLEVTYATPVYATGLTIFESYNSGFVYQIDLIDTDGGYHTIWSGVDSTPQLNDGDTLGLESQFALMFDATSYLVAGARIYTRNINNWDEIDAVMLISDHSVVSGDGYETVIINAAVNYFDGGAGIDTLDYFNATDGITVDLNIQDGATAQVISAAQGTDTILNFENVSGGAFSDTLIGNEAANWLNGRGGNDILIGGGGNDVLIGGAGADTLTGGAGNDIFKYIATTDSAMGAGDTISDFNASSADIINLQGLQTGTWNGTVINLSNATVGGTWTTDPMIPMPGNPGMYMPFTPTLVGGIAPGSFANTGTTQIGFNETTRLLQVDADGNGSADMDITLTNVSFTSLDTTDFTFA